MLRLFYSILFCLVAASTAAAGSNTGDIAIESEVGAVTTVTSGRHNTETNVHSVRVKDGYSYGGNIVIQGKRGDIINTGSRRKDKTVNRGSVVIGPRK